MGQTDTRGALADAHKAKTRRIGISAIPPTSKYYWIRLVFQNPTAAVSFFVVITILLLAAFAGVIASVSPNYVDPVVRLNDPGSTYWFGTDTLGRDVFSRVLHGARVSLLVGAVVMVGAGFVGSVIGLAAGYYNRFDNVLMRLMDGFEAFPGILLAIAIMASLGAATENVVIALVVVFTPNVARLVRGTTLVTKQQVYVESARAIGMRDVHILRRYVFVNGLSPLIVQCTFMVATSILAEASLSFLGAGVPPGIPTWGNMVSEGQGYLQRAWWIAVFPGTFLFITVLAINLIGDGLRDALDPRSRER